MPAIRSRHQANGSGSAKDAVDRRNNIQSEAQAIVQKKLQYLEEEQEMTQNGYEKTKMNGSKSIEVNNGVAASEEEVFLDTSSQATAHSTHNSARQSNHINGEEKIIIYDGQSNTSIAQTAKDQFAAALLRLQSGLDESSKRLLAVESKVDDLIKQQRYVQQQQQQAKNKQNDTKKGLGKFLNQSTATFLYLGWPVIVFLAMRAIEKRTSTAAASAAIQLASK